MNEYTDANGIEFTDDDIEEWAAEAESAPGYVGKHLGPSVTGRPTSSRE